MPHVVVVALTVDHDDPEQAVEFVREQRAAKLATDDQPWQTEAHLSWPITPSQDRSWHSTAQTARLYAG